MSNITPSNDSKTMSVHDQSIEEIVASFKKVLDVSKTDTNNIPSLVALAMTFVGHNFRDLTGADKKKLVIRLLQELSPIDLLDAMIPMMIDVLVSVDKGKIVINPKITGGFRSCFKHLKCKCC